MAHTNTIIPSTNEVHYWESKVIAQVEQYSFWSDLIGPMGDQNAFVYRPPEVYKKGGSGWIIPLAKAITDAAIEDGDAYEGQGKTTVLSTVEMNPNERGQVFGDVVNFEQLKTVVNLREAHWKQAADWATQDFDSKLFTVAKLATSSLPLLSARSSSQYNVEYQNDAPGWAGLDDTHKITAKGISKAKKYFMAKRGLRPADLGGGKMGFILIVPAEATLQLGTEDTKFQEALKYALPRAEDHVFFKGFGMNPWGAWDGVIIVEDTRPVYGGTYGSFLNVEQGGGDSFVKFEGLFLGAQAIAYGEWEPLTWYERIHEHGRKWEMSVRRTFGAVKPVINLGTLGSASNRDYGIGYFCATAPAIS